MRTTCASCEDNGIRGVKLHPLFQDLSLADPRVRRADAGAGRAPGSRSSPTPAPAATRRRTSAARPHAPARAARRGPDLTLIACHYGGYHRLDEAEAAVVGLRGRSWRPRGRRPLGRRSTRTGCGAIIARHGADRVVFGSDWPMTDPAAEIAAIRALGLRPADEAGDPRRQPRGRAGSGGVTGRGAGARRAARAARAAHDGPARAAQPARPTRRPPCATRCATSSPTTPCARRDRRQADAFCAGRPARRWAASTPCRSRRRWPGRPRSSTCTG